VILARGRRPPARRVRACGAAALAAAVAVAVAACSSPEPPPAPPAETPASGVVITPTGVVAPILSSFDGGYWVRTPCFGVGLVLGDDDEITRIDRATVVLDAGHGGPELGAVGPNGLEEKAVNLDVTQQVAERLREGGVDVVVTRTGDGSFVTLRTRAEIATALDPEVFVSIHHNSAELPASDEPGTEAYFAVGSEDSERLGQWLHQDVVAALTPFDVDWQKSTDNPGAMFRQGENGDFYGILRYSRPVPAVIIEAAFISHAPEADFLRTPAARTAEAGAIATSIRRYLDNPPGTPGATTSSTSILRGPVPAGGEADTDPVDEPPAATTTVPGTIPVYAPAEDAEGCVDPPLL
jgi:N-acetylmuramoyl-L-alanine amidase